MRIKMFLVFVLLHSSGCMLFGNAKPSDREKRAGSLLNSGIEYLRAHDYENAKASFGASFELSPEPASIDGLGCVALMTGDRENAKAYFQRAIELDEQYSPAVHHLALVNDLSGNKFEAKKLYETAIKNSPDSASLRNDYGALIYDQWLSNKEAKNLKEQAKILFAQSELLGGTGIGKKNKEKLFGQDNK